MAATQTVPQLPRPDNCITEIAPRSGVITLSGYGIRVHVDRGHLVVGDGIGFTRGRGRFARIRHGLRRLIVIGSDGFVSLAALRWLADQDAAFVMLERDGSVLATTGPVRPSDARLRRAQGLAHQSGAALNIARELISKKLTGQERLVRDILQDTPTSKLITSARVDLARAESIPAIRLLESQAAHAYWSAWSAVPVTFPQRDLSRVPDHWRIFGTRQSPLTGSPRLAVNPPNAMLNYLYALLEAESRLALAALGLDPGIGMLHVDTPSRDSLACDLMETARPQVDAYVLDWIRSEPLRREWFFEKRDGNCRLMAPFARRLSETTTTWGHAVAPVAEWIAHTLWSGIQRSRQIYPATRLTQSHRCEARGSPSEVPPGSVQRPPRICRSCGRSLKRGRNYCAKCSKPLNKAGLIEAARLGRVAAHSSKAEALRAATQRRHAAAMKSWNPSDKPEWLTEEAYREKVQSCLVEVTAPAISTALGVSEPYATDIRSGRRRPHPRHWLTLARLVGLSSDTPSAILTGK